MAASADSAGPAGFVDAFDGSATDIRENSGEEADEEGPAPARPAAPVRPASPPLSSRSSASARAYAIPELSIPLGGGASASSSRGSSSGGSARGEAEPPLAQRWSPPWAPASAGGSLLCPADVLRDQDWDALARAMCPVQSCTRAAALCDHEYVPPDRSSSSLDRGRGPSEARATLEEPLAGWPQQAAQAAQAAPRLPLARRHRGGLSPERGARADGVPPRPPRLRVQHAPPQGDEPVDHLRSSASAAAAAGSYQRSPRPSPVAQHLQAAVSEANRVVQRLPQRLRGAVGDSARRSSAESGASSSSAPFRAAGQGGEGGGRAASAPCRRWTPMDSSSGGDEEAALTPREGTPQSVSPIEFGVWIQRGVAQLNDKFRKHHNNNMEWAMNRVNLGRELAKAKLLDVSAPMRSSMLGGLKTMIRDSAVADPDMWPWVRRGVEDAVGSFLDDLEHEIEENLEAALLKQKSLRSMQGPSGSSFQCIYRIRAFILYHFLPYDKSIFGKLKDPVYLCMLLLTLLPFALVRVAFYSVVLAMIVFPRPPDEFQLVNFILLFKGSQFLNAGLMMMGKGSMKYFICFSLHPGHMTKCVVEKGPGASDSLVNALIDYVGNCLLVWISFRLLPYSEKHVSPKYVAREPQYKTPQDTTAGEGFGADSDRGKGGKLGRLLMYDVKCFAMTLVVLAVVAVVTWRLVGYEEQDLLHWLLRSAHFREDLFWCKVLYGILSLPFLPFSVSFLLKVLTHCEYTGYNEWGGCVAFDIPLDNFVPTSEAKATKTNSQSNTPPRT